MASKLTLWINQKLKDKGMSAKDAQKDAGKYKSIAAAKKAGSLYYTDKNGKVKIAAYAEDLKNVGKKKETGGIADDPMFSPIKVTELDDEKMATSIRAKGRSPDDTTSKSTTEKRDPSKRIQALKDVSNAKLVSRIRAKLNDPSFRKSRSLNTLKNSLEAALKIDTSSLRGERMQKMQLDSLLSKVDRMIMNTGGMVNPTTGLKMNAMGNIDYRTTGMFYGGGMTKKR